MRSKSWNYHDSKKGNDYKYNTITWAYEKNNYDDKAQAWFYLYTYEGLTNKIQYQFHTAKQLTRIESSMVSYGYKKIDGDILDGQIVTRYANSNYILAISYISSQDDYTALS